MYQLPQQPPVGYPTQNASNVPLAAVPMPVRGEQLGFSDFFGMLRRHRIAFGVTIFLSLLVALVVALSQTTRFAAQADLVLDMRKPQVLKGDGVVPDIPIGNNIAEAALRSEVAMIGSASIVGRVVDKLGLVNDPEFNPALKPEDDPDANPVARFVASVGKAVSPAALMAQAAALFGMEVEKDTDLLAELGPRGIVIRNVSRNLLVVNDGRSFVLSVLFTSENPNKAALIANTFAEEYLASQVQLKQEALERAQVWLNERVESLRKDVDASAKQMLDLRDTNNIVQLQNGTVTAQQLAELNTQLIQAQALTAQAQARLRSAQQLRSNSGRYDGTLEVVQAQAIQALKQQEGELRRREAEYASHLGPKHPQLIQVRAEVEALRRKIDEEIDVIVRGLQNEVNVAVSREQALTRALAELEAKVTVTDRAQVQIEQIGQDAQTSRTLLDSVLIRYKELLEQTDIQEPDARIISEAQVPTDPVGLGRKQLVAAGFGLGGILGIIVVLALEQVARGFRTTDEVERALGLPVLGLVPRLRFGRWRNPIDYVADRPMSIYAEALRRLFATVRLTARLRPGSVMVVSSALPGEGKTTLVMSLARVLAGAGVRVLVIEGDMRRPALSKMLDPADKAGLCDVLAERRELATAIQNDPKSGAHILFAGQPSADAADLLDPRRVRLLFDEVRRHYDLVLVDTAPVLVISDSIVMAEQADAVLLAARWSRTPRRLVVKATSLLRECGANLVGTVLSRVEVAAEDDVGAVYKSARRYYAN